MTGAPRAQGCVENLRSSLLNIITVLAHSKWQQLLLPLLREGLVASLPPACRLPPTWVPPLPRPVGHNFTWTGSPQRGAEPRRASGSTPTSFRCLLCSLLNLFLHASTEGQFTTPGGSLLHTHTALITGSLGGAAIFLANCCLVEVVFLPGNFQCLESTHPRNTRNPPSRAHGSPPRSLP